MMDVFSDKDKLEIYNNSEKLSQELQGSRVIIKSDTLPTLKGGKLIFDETLNYTLEVISLDSDKQRTIQVNGSGGYVYEKL